MPITCLALWRAFSNAACLGILSLALWGATFDAHSKPKKGKARVAVSKSNVPTGVPYGRRVDVMRFGLEMSRRHQLDTGWVQANLARSQHIPRVTKLIMPTPVGTAKSWAEYRERFVEPHRIRAGLEFWNTHLKWLNLAEKRYGVPPEIVVGIIGVETLYGERMGEFRVIDALATLTFDFPTGRSDRSAFFRNELEQFLVLCNRARVNPLSLQGSYAGAIGMGQFMPSTWNKYAIDFNGDKRIDLLKSAPDVIGSVARYLAEFGWQRGQPTHFEAVPPADLPMRAAMLMPDILPIFTAAQFVEYGAQLPSSAAAFEGKLALVELQNGPAEPSYFAGTPNFYAVTRYNWSSYYAMTVLALSEALKQWHDAYLKANQQAVYSQEKQ